MRDDSPARTTEYVIKADAMVKPGVDASVEKYRDQFRRRVEDGQSFHRPYLGCREFAAHFSKPSGDEKPIDYSDDLGLMLFDMEYGGAETKPRFFSARLEGGVLRMPESLYEGSRK